MIILFLWRFFAKKFLHFILPPILKSFNYHQSKSKSNSKIEIYENLEKKRNDNDDDNDDNDKKKKKRGKKNNNNKKNGRKDGKNSSGSESGSEINGMIRKKTVVIVNNVEKLSLRNNIDVIVKFIVYAGKLKNLLKISHMYKKVIM